MSPEAPDTSANPRMRLPAAVAFMKTFLSRLPVQVEFAEKSAGADETIDGLSPLDAANRAVAYQERMKRDGVVITTTEALSAVKAGKDNGAQ